MKLVGRWLGICGALLFGALAEASDSEVNFLRTLRESGYGDVAVDYLKLLEKRSELPPEIRDSWELEMARSLRAAATNAYNAADAEALTAEAQKYLDKFLKEKPNHAMAFEALADSATFTKARALTALRNAETATDPAKKAQFIADARKLLDEAKPKFKESYEKFKAALAKLPEPPRRPSLRPTKKEREITEAYFDCMRNMAAARYEQALSGYYIAQTFADPKDPARTALLKETCTALDAIFQEYRYVEDVRAEIAIFAHMWHGKAVEDMGDLKLARDIYEEVLALAPDPNDTNVNPQMQTLFTSVQRFYLGVLLKLKPEDYVDEASQWLTDYNARLKNTDGFGQIALDLANYLLTKSEKATDAEKKKIMAEAKSVCQTMAKTPGPHQSEFRRLMKENFGGGGGGDKSSGDPKTFAEAVSFGDAAMADSNFAEAEKQYAKAQEFLEKPGKRPKKEEIDKLHESRAMAMYMKARGLFRTEPAECLKLSSQVFADFSETAAGPPAGALRVQVQLFIYGSIDGKDPKKADARAAALAELEKLASEVIDKWPGKPEADDARIALGQAALVRDDLKKAIATFSECNPKSDRYGTAMQYAGQSQWRRCLLERQKVEAQQDKSQMKTDAEEAAKKLDTAVKLQKQQLEKKKGDEAKAVQKTLVDMQLMLADIYSYSNEPAKAAEVLQPLVDVVIALPKSDEEIDPATLRIAVGAVRSFLASNQLEKAVEIGLKLNEVGPDKPTVNNVLVEFAKQLNSARKQADADKIEAGNDAAKIKAAEAKLASVKGSLTKLLPKLAERKELGVNTMVMLGDFLAAADLNDLASAQFDKILKEYGSDEKSAKAMTRVRVQLVGLLKKKGDYERAAAQMAEILKGQPNALDALMEEARILQAWATEKDPSKWVAAATKWNQLLERLKGSKSKEKPPEFFEVTYNLAMCLANDAVALAKKDEAESQKKFKAAQQLLKSTLFNSPKLNGPDMVAKYNALIEKLGKALKQAPAPK